MLQGYLMSKNIEILYNLAQKGCVTHSSRFHADDVLSAALLKISGVIPDVSVIQRVGRVPQDFDGLAFDIGGGEFDHHQHNARVRPNGNKYAAFGLLWNAVGVEYIAGKYKTDIKTINSNYPYRSCRTLTRICAVFNISTCKVLLTRFYS